MGEMLRCQTLIIEDDPELPDLQCPNYTDAVTLLRIGDNCAMMLALCPAHNELAVMVGKNEGSTAV
jgi:hypothetical protein